MGSVLTNSQNGILNNFSGYLDSSDTYQANTTGAISVLKNLGGAVLNNGDSTGGGLILNGAVAIGAFSPTSPGSHESFNDGAEFDNLGSTINNQNGSHLDNVGVGSVLTNSQNGILNNFSGYLDSSDTYQANTTGAISVLKNLGGAVLNNGDSTGGGTLILNRGGRSLGPSARPLPDRTRVFNDGAEFDNLGSTINNQNSGSHLDNVGVGSVLTNSQNGILNNFSGYLDLRATPTRPTTTGAISVLKNLRGCAVLNNGDSTGGGLILNGAVAMRAYQQTSPGSHARVLTTRRV